MSIDRNSHIPTEEIQSDILITEGEITQLKREQEGFTLIGDRMSMFKAENRRSQISQREEFIRKLQGILDDRESLPGNQP